MMKMKKLRDLAIISAIYFAAFAVGAAACLPIGGNILKFFVFDTAATVFVFIFSVLFHNSSVYDAYWSVAPMVISIWLFIREKAFGAWQIACLSVFLLWGARLTANWIAVFTDFSYEDWRYKKYRAETPRIFWQVVNFFGIHYMPTLVVFLGMLPLFEIVKKSPGALSLAGLAVMLAGILLEFFADRQMHDFLKNGQKGAVCRKGFWNWSRHPNYLGEISFWVGVYLVMLPTSPEKWYFGIGCVAVALLFNVVSIPLMEKRQLSRRESYKEYQKTISRLLILPHKKRR